jgi:Secretion system C-terminal sorting domain
MKSFAQITLAVYLLLASICLNAQISIGGYHVYYGHLVGGTTTSPGMQTAILQVISPAEGELNCYPVPFTGKLNISFEPAGNELLQYIAIYEVSGTLMKKISNPRNKLSLSLEDLVPGVYLVGTQTDRNRYVKTVVKQ